MSDMQCLALVVFIFLLWLVLDFARDRSRTRR